MNENTLFEVVGCSNWTLSFRWCYTKCKGIKAFERLKERIQGFAEAERINGDISIEYGQPRRNKERIKFTVYGDDGV